MKSTSSTVFSLAGLCWALAGAPAAHGPFTFPERPGPRDFLLDQAEVLDPGQAGRIRRTCDRLLTDTATPIIVVTLRSLADHAPPGATPEDYARALFNRWQIGHARVDGRPWDTGILVLWVQDTGRIRVELGRGWGHAKDGDERAKASGRPPATINLRVGPFRHGRRIGLAPKEDGAGHPREELLSVGISIHLPAGATAAPFHAEHAVTSSTAARN